MATTTRFVAKNGLDNNSNNILNLGSLGSNLSLSGGYSISFTSVSTTSLTLPTTGTLVTSAVTTLSSLSSIGTVTTGTWNASTISVSFGGTGVTSLTEKSLLLGNGTSPITFVSGTPGQLLIVNSSTTPAFVSMSGAITISNTGVTSFRNAAALSVLGNTTNTSAAITDISGTTDQILRISGTTLGFGSIDLSKSGTSVTGLLSLANGGTNANLTANNGGIVYSSSTSFAILSGTSNAGKILISGASAAPSWLENASIGTTNFSLYSYGTSTGNTFELRFYDIDSTDYVGFKSPDTISLTTSYILPASGPSTTGKVLKATGINGSDVTLSWEDDDIGAAGAITSLNGQTGAVQTFANDTNVTITSSSNVHTLGWTNYLSIARGGTNTSGFTTSNQLIIFNGTNLATLGTGTANQVLIGGGTSSPSFGAVNLNSAMVSGTLQVNRGGTGSASFTTSKVIVSAITSTGALSGAAALDYTTASPHLTITAQSASSSAIKINSADATNAILPAIIDTKKIGVSTRPGLRIENSEASNSVNTVQNSPALELVGHAWNNTADTFVTFRQEIQPSASASPTGNFVIRATTSSSYATTAFTDVFRISNSGVVSIPVNVISSSTSTGSLVVAGGIGVQNTSYLSTTVITSLSLTNVLQSTSGGTGTSTFVDKGVFVGNGTTSISFQTSTTQAQFLISDNTNTPVFRSITGDISFTYFGTSTFRNGTALSVLGNSSNSSAQLSDIVASSDFQVLRRSGTSIGFGSIDISKSGTSVTGILQYAHGGTGTSTFTSENIIFAQSGNLSGATSFTYSTSSDTLNLVGSSISAPNLLIRKDNITTNSRLAVRIANSTVSTAGTSIQNPPALEFYGNVWDTNPGVNNISRFRFEVSQSSLADPTAELRINTKIDTTDTSSLDTRFSISASGIVSIPTVIASSGTTSGALVVAGGIGVQSDSYLEDLYVTGTSLNAASATEVILGTTSSGTSTLNSPTVNFDASSPVISASTTGTLSLFNSNVTVVNAFGAATSIVIGAGSVGSALRANVQNITTILSSLNLFTSTTNLFNLFTASTSVNFLHRTNGTATYNFGTTAAITSLTATSTFNLFTHTGAAPKVINIGTLGTGSVTVNIGTTSGTSNITINGNLVLSNALSAANGGTGNTSYTDGQLLIGNSSTGLLTKSTLTAGSNISITNGNGSIIITNTAGGTVTSVGLAVPSIFELSTSVITTSGTFTVSLQSTSANYVFAGPTTGSAAAPSFRALVANDIPSLSSLYAPVTSGTSILYGNGSGGFSSVTIGSNLTFSAGTLSATDTNTTYTNGTGITLTGTTFSINNSVVTLNGSQTLSNKTIGTGGLIFAGTTSGTTVIKASSTPASNTLTLPTSSDTIAVLGDIKNGTLTLAVSGNGLSGSASFSANTSSTVTFTVDSNATSSNSSSTIVFRDSSGNFSANTVSISGLVLGSNSGALSASSGTVSVGTLTVGNGGTGVASFVTSRLLVSNSSSTTGVIETSTNIIHSTSNLSFAPHGASAGNTFELRFNELSGSEYVALKAPDSILASYVYVLPSAAPTSGQILSASAPSGNVITLSWTNDNAGSAGSGTISEGEVGKISYYTGTTTVDDAIALDYSNSTTSAHLQITSQAVGNTPLSLKASSAGTQTANLFDIRDSSSSALFSVGSTGIVLVNNTTASSSTTTGALQVAGGIGVQSDSYLKDVYVSNINLDDTNSANYLRIQLNTSTLTANRTLNIVTGDSNRTLKLSGDLEITATSFVSGSNTGDQLIELTGDVTGSGTGQFSTQLSNTGVSAGTYNDSSSSVRPFTVDAKGRITNIGSAVTITPSFDSITNKPSTLAGYGITDSLSNSTTSTQTGYFGSIYLDDPGSVNYLKIHLTTSTLSTVRTLNLVTGDSDRTLTLSGNLTVSSTSSISGDNTGDQTINLTGDITGTGTTTFATALSATGVSAGTYNNASTSVRPFTVDSKGRITNIGSAVTIRPAFSNITGTPTTLAGYGITNALTNSTTSTQVGYFGSINLDDTNSANYLRVQLSTTTLTTSRVLNLVTGDADRSITLSGNLIVSGDSSISGNNTGDQTIELTGEVTGSGTSQFAATIANGVVTFAKMQNSVSGLSVIGKSTSGSGSFAEISTSVSGSVLRLSGSNLEFGSIDISNSNTVGISVLPVSNGGTGTSSFTTSRLLITSTSASNGQLQTSEALQFSNTNNHLSIIAQGSSITPLLLKANSTEAQTSNLFDIQNSSSASLFTVGSSGIVTLTNNTASSGTTNGALVVSGGIGVQADSYLEDVYVVGTTLRANSATNISLGTTTGTSTILNANVNLGTTAVEGTVSVLSSTFTATNAKTVTLGPGTTGGTIVNLNAQSVQSSLASVDLFTTGGGTYRLFSSSTTVSIFNRTSGTAVTINLGTTGTATNTSTINILSHSGSGTKTLNIGAFGSGTTNITLGTTSGTSTITVLANTITFSGKRLQNIADPSDPQDAATRAYVDSVSQGLDVHDSVKAMSASAIGTSVTYFQQNGASTTSGFVIGTSYIESANNESLGTTYFDGVTLSATSGDRVLVAGGASTVSYNIGASTSTPTGGTSVINGIYTVTSIGSGTSKWRLDRASDSNDNLELVGGTYVWVEQGTLYGSSAWICTNDTNSVKLAIGQDAITFTKFSSAGTIEAGDGLTKTNSTLNAVGTANRISVNPDSIDIASTYVGQTSITTLGTITTGVWDSTATNIAITSGGTNTSSYSSNNGIIYYDSLNSRLSTLQTGASTTVLVGSGSGNVPTYDQVNLGTMVTGTLAISQGGTNNTSFATTYGFIYFDGSKFTQTSAANSGQLLLSPNTSTAASWTNITGDVTLNGSGTTAIGTNKVTNSMLRQSSGLSVIGRSANSTGDVADITASLADTILRYNGTNLSFGAINLSSTNAVSGYLPVISGGTGATTATDALNNLGALSNSSTSTQIGYFGSINLDDTNSTNYLRLQLSDTILTLNRTLNLVTGDADRTLTLSGNLTVSSTASISGNNTGDQTINLTGDVTGTGTTTFSTALSTTGVSAGTYNNATTSVSPFTVDSKGRITNVGSEVTITPSFTSITGIPTTISGYGITDALTNSTTSTQVGYFGSINLDDTNSANYLRIQLSTSTLTENRILNLVTGNADRTLTLSGNLNVSAAASISGDNTGDQTIELTGDVTGSGTGEFSATIANAAVTFAKMQNSAAGPSVVGRTNNVAGSFQEITASSDGHVLRRSSSAIGFGSIDLSLSNSVGISILNVANGGTATSTFTSNAVLYGNGGSAIQSVGSSTTDAILKSSSSGAPSFSTSFSGTSYSFGVTASGTFTINSPTIVSGSSSINLFNSTTTTLNFGGALTALSIASTTATATINIATGVTAVSSTKTLNLGTNGSVNSTNNINIGTGALGTINITIGSDTSLSTTNVTTQTVNIGTSTAGTTTIRSSNFDANNVNIKSGNEFKVYDTDNSNYVALKAAATGTLTSNITFILPATQGSSGQYLRNNGSGSALTWSNLPQSKSITILSPTNTDKVTLFFTETAVTITKVVSVIRGTSGTSSWQLYHGTSRASGTAVFASSQNTTSTTTGDTLTSFSSSSVTTNSFVWLETGTQTSVSELHITIFYN